MSRSYVPVAAILKAVLPSASRSRLSSIDLVRAGWPTSVGNELALRSEPVSLADGVLTVRVTDATWGRTMVGLQKDIIPRLSEATGSGPVSRLRFVRDGRPLWESGLPVLRRRRHMWGGPTEEPTELPAALVQAAGAIDDPRIRSELLRIAARYLTAQAHRGRDGQH